MELHFHLLAGIDDGPASMQDSVELAAAAVADGTSTVVATPHIRPEYVADPTELPQRVRELTDRLRSERIPLEVLAGGELPHFMVGRLSDRQLDAIAHGPAGKRWVLLEAPFNGLEPDFSQAADELRRRGFAVVLAHPERARPTPGTAAAIEHELALGSPLQLTAGSLIGDFGEPVRSIALALLRRAPRGLISSDAHGEIRMPAMRSAVGALADAGFPNPRRLAEALPRALLEDGLGVRRVPLVA